jgi:hypothetical protein
MTPEQFVGKWRNSTRTEKSAAHEHFLDLCELLDVKKPAESDPHLGHPSQEWCKEGWGKARNGGTTRPFAF